MLPEAKHVSSLYEPTTRARVAELNEKPKMQLQVVSPT